MHQFMGEQTEGRGRGAQEFVPSVGGEKNESTEGNGVGARDARQQPAAYSRDQANPGKILFQVQLQKPQPIADDTLLAVR